MKTFRRLRGRCAFAGLALLFLPHAATACQQCFGAAANTPTTQGISMAMLSLILLIGLISVGIVWFFNNMRKRADLLQPGNYTVSHLGEILPLNDADPS